jgi:F-type H+-transporting ATPase subunit b
MVFLGITDLGINLPALVGQMLNFFVLLLVLRLVAYKPILKILDERRERIAAGLALAEQSRDQAEQANREALQQIEAARREGHAIIAQAQQIGVRLQEEARQQAQTQADALVARARSEIQLERDTAISELRREFADLTISAAEKVINQSLDRQAHQRLIQDALAESSFREN